jgi:hypothetical protein
VPELSPAAQAGQVAFQRTCAPCHGDVAQGTATGPPLVHEIYRPAHHADIAFELAVRCGARTHHWCFGDMPAQATVPAGEGGRSRAISASSSKRTVSDRGGQLGACGTQPWACWGADAPDADAVTQAGWGSGHNTRRAQPRREGFRGVERAIPRPPRWQELCSTPTREAEGRFTGCRLASGWSLGVRSGSQGSNVQSNARCGQREQSR